jgi:hypothetical protein
MFWGQFPDTGRLKVLRFGPLNVVDCARALLNLGSNYVAFVRGVQPSYILVQNRQASFGVAIHKN